MRSRELEEALGVLSSFDEGADLVLYYKHLMVLNGDAEYTLHFNETDALSDSQRNYVETQYRLFHTLHSLSTSFSGSTKASSSNRSSPSNCRTCV